MNKTGKNLLLVALALVLAQLATADDTGQQRTSTRKHLKH